MGTSWLQSHLNDSFVKKRIQNNHISRSYYKIEEINKKFNIIYKNSKILDLGACPGGWTEYIWKYTHNVTPVDINNNWKLTHIPLIQKNIFDLNLNEKYDTIVSDIACNLTGNNDIDEPAMSVIIDCLLNIVKTNLRPNGHFVCKIFDYNVQMIKSTKLFTKYFFFKPEASKSKSAEIYFVGKNYIGT